jgi:hypothetical protein
MARAKVEREFWWVGTAFDPPYEYDHYEYGYD